MKIAEGLDMLEIRVEREEGTTVFCPVLIWDDEDVTYYKFKGDATNAGK